MSPRPLKPVHEAFDACLEVAAAGQHLQALEQLRRTLSARPLHAQVRSAAVEALSRISRMAETAGDLEQAARGLEEALRIAPGFADIHYRLARVRVASGQPAGARQSLEGALSIHPGYVAARVELALLDAREGRLAEAIDTLRRLDLEQSPHEPRLFREGIQSLEHADWQEAGTRLRQALHLDEPGLNEMLEDVRQRIVRGDRVTAARMLREALVQHPGYADLLCWLGIAELEEGHLDDAIATLARALELHPDYHAARVQLARALEALGDLVQAEEQIGWVLDSDPRNPQALELAERWGRLHRRRGRSSVPSRKAS